MLVGRRAPGEGAKTTIHELQAQGCQIYVRQADVSRGEEVEALLTEIVAATLPPLKGIIHAAGVLDDGVLSQQNWSRWETVLMPKVRGAWNLHQATRDLPLDFFVLYSSVASVLGSAGQSNYAAANAFLDGLAQHRQSLGLPALSVNWGPWAEEGMSTNEVVRRQLAKQRIIPLKAKMAHAAMEELFVEAWPVVVSWMRTGTNWRSNDSSPCSSTCWRKRPRLSKATLY